jgi:prophage endopeptidase
MDRTEIVVGMAVILFGTFLLGWAAHWLFHKFNRVNTSNVTELDAMASALHDAEETRDEAIAYMQQREAELLGQLGQTEAELRAAMDGLGDARREVAELRYYIEENSA